MTILDDFIDEYPLCPACGSPIDFCQGHGEIGDPAGFAILEAHDRGDHKSCAIKCEGNGELR